MSDGRATVFLPTLGGRAARRAWDADLLTGALPADATFSRPSGATRINHRGYLEEVGNDVARFTYDPALEYNLFTNPWADGLVVGALGSGGAPPTDVWGVQKSASITAFVVGSGVESGVPYYDMRVFGTTGNTFTIIYYGSSGNVAPTVPGQKWSVGVWHSVVGGSLNNISSTQIRFAWPGGVPAGGVANVALTSDLTFVSGSFTASSGATAIGGVGLILNHSSGVPIDVTIRIGFPTITPAATPITDRIPLATLAERRNGVPQYGLLGMMVEEASTNYVRNPRYEGATPGVVGSGGVVPTDTAFAVGNGLSTEIVGVFQEAGRPYVRVRWFGTAAATSGMRPIPSITNAAPAVLGDTATHAISVRLAAGTWPFTSLQVELREYAGGSPASGLSGTNIPTPTSTFVQTSHTRVMTDPTTTQTLPTLRFGVNAGTVVDVTLDFSLPTLEKGGAITSPILPPVGSPAASTRAAETPTVPLGPWYRQDQGTLIVEGAFGPATRAVQSHLATIDDGTSTNFIVVRSNVAHDRLVSEIAPNGGLILQQVHTPAVSPGQMRKVAVAWRSANSGGAAVGVAGTPSTTAFGTPALTTMRLGHSTNVQQTLNGILRRITYYPRRLSDAQLARLTQP